MGAFRDAFKAEMDRQMGKVEDPLLDVLNATDPNRGQWEYKVLNTGWGKNTQAGKLEDTLNKLGREGWELVAAVNNPETSMMSKHVTQYLLKRYIEAQG